MSTLESRYRAVLRWYPSDWRARHADVVVGTLLDNAEAAGRSQPQRSELVNLALNGVRTRLGHVATVSNEVRDHIAVMAFGTGFALMALMLVGDEWTPLVREGYWPAVFGPFHSAAVIVNLLWIAAFGLAVLGLGRWAKAVLGAAIVASVVAILAIESTPLLYARPPASALAFLIVLAALAMAGSPSRARLVRSALAAAGVFSALCLVQYSANSWPFDGALRWGWYVTANGWWAIALFVLAAVLVALRQPQWVASLTMFGALWALYSIGTGFTNRPDAVVLISGTIATGLCVAAIAGASALLGGYRLQIVRVNRS